VLNDKIRKKKYRLKKQKVKKKISWNGTNGMELEHLNRNLTKKSIDIESEMKFVLSFFIF